MRLRRVATAAVAAGMAASSALALSTPADAYTLTGTHWNHTALTLCISGTYPDTGSGWQNAFTAWNSAGTKIRFSTPGCNQPIRLYDTNDSSTSFDGFSTWQYSGGVTTSANGTINYYYTRTYTLFTIKGVAAHELGHILGLNHAGGCVLMASATSTRSSCGINTPQADDKNGVNSLY